MTDPRPLYSVILKAEVPALERELLRRYCHELHGTDGSTLLHFLCTRIEPGHPHYLEFDAILPRRQGLRRLRLPHAFVFLIEGDGKSDAEPGLPGGGSLLEH